MLVLSSAANQNDQPEVFWSALCQESEQQQLWRRLHIVLTYDEDATREQSLSLFLQCHAESLVELHAFFGIRRCGGIGSCHFTITC